MRIIILAILLFFSIQVDAQKFGYIDSQQFIADLPVAQKVDKELLTYREQLVSATNALQADLDKRAAEFEAEYTSGKLSKVAAEKKYLALENEQKAIYERRKEDEQKMLKKREELFQPIFSQVDAAIKAVGKEYGFTFIFDASFYNALLYLEGAEDVTELVRKKL